jgi:hypothetical protein
VRTHLDNIFRKTGVSRQQDLLLLAAQLSPPAEMSSRCPRRPESIICPIGR